MMAESQSSEYIGDELELFSKATNWKRYWCSKIRPFLGDNVLEVGSGVGANIPQLITSSTHWIALEPDSDQCDRIQTLWANSKLPGQLTVRCGTLGDFTSSTQLDTILYIDVLEHIQDDRRELELAVELLKPGGRLVVLAPAHNCLYSAFDKAVGHYRRYNKSMLRNIIPAGSTLEKLFYLDSVGCIASWANSKLLKSSLPTPKQIWLWDKCMVPLSYIADLLTIHHLGKSIIMVIRK